ncbi:MAG: fumarylacetoacetate hydrolase family protein [Actinomycetota bacterium]|nr:fumarylacetoacetate hydrolase family protein [Actinomycetota bacterium]
MKLANLDGRLVIVDGVRAVDVERASGGEFLADPQAMYERWDAFVEWATSVDPAVGDPFDPSRLGPPVPRPAQVFAIGVNYAEHAAEAGYPRDSLPVTFTKFPSCLTGPLATVTLPSEFVDWEVELVVAVARRADRVSRDDAWKYVAGYTIGQDLSERHVQLEGTKPQFSLGKSYRGFGPTGPWLVTLDEFADASDLAIQCGVEGETLQQGRTSSMIYDVPELIARLSAVCTLFPGDIIFSGTPSGVGNARTPQRFLAADDVLVSSIEGIGSMTTTFVVAS